ncbi:hypothetical protein [Streptomyces sp. NPDC059649]|uniref:hypothetical protein n=1 Tax=Streptomyces sp. NPDC059649 TaxID=3346895 RepID=UPI00368AC4D1
MPHDFPSYKTVYDSYATWETDGTTQLTRDPFRDRTRRTHGRSTEPATAVVDAQSVKTSGNVAETSQGIDAPTSTTAREADWCPWPKRSSGKLVVGQVVASGSLQHVREGHVQ